MKKFDNCVPTTSVHHGEIQKQSSISATFSLPIVLGPFEHDDSPPLTAATSGASRARL